MNLLSSTKTMMNALEFVPLKHVKNQFMVTNANATNTIRCINNLSYSWIGLLLWTTKIA